MHDKNTPNQLAKKGRSNGRLKIAGEYLIDLKNVVKIYEGSGGSFTALRGISLQVKEGEFVAVVGKSGSGKSTLLNMITGIDRPSTGEVIITGTPIHLLSEGKMAVWRGNKLGIVFQFFQLLPTLTVLENIMIPMDFCHKFKLKERKERAVHLLEEVDLLEQANKLPSALSGGQQQRVAIARALANDPPILVADEPTGNLDSMTAETVFRLFNRLVDQGKTILTVTHDLDLAKKVTRTIFIADGLIEQDSTNPIFGDSQQVLDENLRFEADDLVKLKGNESSYSLDASSSNGTEQELLQDRIRRILLNPTNSTQLLQEEFQNASEDDVLMDDVYSAVITQARLLSDQAESENRIDDAKRIWKIVMDAAKPWVNPS